MRRQWIDRQHRSVASASFSGFLGPRNYYSPVGVSDENLELVRLLDEQYTRTPYFGSPRMTAWLRRNGHHVNRKRVERLMRLMG